MKIFVIATVLLLTAFHGKAKAIWIDSVDVVPSQPLEIDVITFNIFGRSSARPSRVAYDQFSQDGTSLLLDLYITVGVLPAFSDWTYSKEIQQLSPATYSLEVRAFDNYYNMLWDTYTVDFTVVPEPCTLVIVGAALPFFRAFLQRKT